MEPCWSCCGVAVTELTPQDREDPWAICQTCLDDLTERMKHAEEDYAEGRTHSLEDVAHELQEQHPDYPWPWKNG